jgi:hypothetical protein
MPRSPFTFIATYRVLPDGLDAFRDVAAEYAEFVEHEEPDVIDLALYFDGEGTRFVHVIVLPDAEAMEHHLPLVRSFITKSAEYVVAEEITVLGVPGPRLQAALDGNAELGARVEVLAGRGPGFSRAAIVPA